MGRINIIKFLLLTLTLCLNISLCLAQKGKGAATSAPQASGASTAATTANSQSGYVYRIKFGYHIQYGTEKDTTFSVPRDPEFPVAQNYVEACITRDSIYCDTPVEKANYVGPQSRQTQSLCKDCINPLFIESAGIIVQQSTCVGGGGAGAAGGGCPIVPTSLRTGNHVDSLSRYWSRSHQFFTTSWRPSRFWKIFNRYRLQVAITPGDSGKLGLVLYERRFLPHDLAREKQNITEAIFKVGGVPVGTEYAHAIALDDSASAFYLQVNNRKAVGDAITFISLPYSMTQYGAMTIPFKYRWAPKQTVKIQVGNTATPEPAQSESSASINVAAYVGRKWGRTRFYYDATKTNNTVSFMLAAFAGPSLVTLTANNIDSSKSTNTEPSSILAIGYGAAAVFEWKLIDFGLFGGMDSPLSKNSGWIYRNRPWIGFGIGISLGMFTTGNAQGQ